MNLLRRKGRAGGQPTRIFYATDIHGSEPTFRKFLNAARFYQVDALVFGGDLMGKLLVPVVKDGREGWRASLQGMQHHLQGRDELEAFTRRLETLGFYWKEMDSDEYAWYEDHQERIDALFDELARERLASWVELAEDRLAGTGVRVYLCGGNSTPTPWQTPRERTDDEIGRLIDDLVAGLADPSRAVFNFHCPPLDSGLDTCMKLDASVWPPAPIMENGQPVYYGAGSASVRRALERYQPVVGLHGHIHESRGVARYGRTPALNPGSEYGEGVLHGVIVAIRAGQVIGWQFTSG